MAESGTDLPVHDAAQRAAADEQAAIVHVITGQTAKGEDFYAYVALKPSRYPEFLKLAGAYAALNVEDYGDVLMKGFGKEPPDHVRVGMEEKFGVDHNFLNKLRQEIEASQRDRPSERLARWILKQD